VPFYGSKWKLCTKIADISKITHQNLSDFQQFVTVFISELEQKQIPSRWQIVHCEWVRRYTGETGRWAAILGTHALSQEGSSGNIKTGQHHWTDWDEDGILQPETNSRYRKHKEWAHMAHMTNPISQPSLEISPLWVPLISKEVGKL
jgi:hypothetical protein